MNRELLTGNRELLTGNRELLTGNKKMRVVGLEPQILHHAFTQERFQLQANSPSLFKRTVKQYLVHLQWT